MPDRDPVSIALEQAAEALRRAEEGMRHEFTPERDAVHRELVTAAASIGRAQCLRGQGR